MCPRATAPQLLKKQGSTKRKPRSPERRAAQEGGGTKQFLTRLTRRGRARNRVIQPDDKREPSDSPDGKVSIQAVPAWGLAGTLGQPRWDGFHPGCASLGTGGDSRTIRESEETRKSSERRSKPPRKPARKKPSKKTPEQKPCTAYVLRTLCVRSRTLHVLPAYALNTIAFAAVT